MSSPSLPPEKISSSPVTLVPEEKKPRKKYRLLKEIYEVAPRVDLVLEEQENGVVVEEAASGVEDGGNCVLVVGEEEKSGGEVVEEDKYEDVACEQCGSGEKEEQLLPCDGCDRGYHLFCLRPIVARVPIGPWFFPGCSHRKDTNLIKRFTPKKILDFFKIQKADEEAEANGKDTRKRRRRALVFQKKSRRLLPYVPTEDPKGRLKQMQSLATGLTAQGVEFSNELTYNMAPRSANQAVLENGGIQVLTKEDTETLEYCAAMNRRGQCPPLIVTFDSCQGYTLEADGPIKDLTLLAEYAGDVDYLKNRERDDCDSLMTLLLSSDPSESLVVCADKRGNIARFISGINNHTLERRKKQNAKFVRYNVNGESRVLLVATRDIAIGERLYCDYNGYEHEYLTHMFV